VITLMAGLYWLVLTPAIMLIRQQVEHLEEHERELEQRVDERTRQLSVSNLALENEVQQRAESEQRTLQLQSQLAHASRLNSLGELATGIAHELNQPLGAISNYAETMLILSDQKPVDHSALERTATRIRESAQRAGAIIRRMRNFVRSKNGPRTLEPVNTLITDVVALCEPDLRSRSVAVHLECDVTSDTATLVDPIQIQQVFVNLIRNAAQAVEFRPVGQRRVTVTTAHHGANVEIHVNDNGEGFPDNFDVASGSLQSTKPDGLGLGLSISRSIIEAHGGKLITANQPDGGARVTVLLPVHETARHLDPADRLCC
jgi:C4-dicarboxylate-specific signal transduction histidine kinase